MQFQQGPCLPFVRHATFNRLVDGIKQILIVKRFGQKLGRALLHRPDRHGNVAVTGYENDGDVDSCGIEFALQI